MLENINGKLNDLPNWMKQQVKLVEKMKEDINEKSHA